MAQPPVQLHQIPSPSFPIMQQSPPSSAPQTPGAGSGFVAMPQNKRQRISPGPPSQPVSPFSTSPYPMSPAVEGTPSTAATSPSYMTNQPPAGQTNNAQAPGQATTPHTNGALTPNLHLPVPRLVPSNGAQPQSPTPGGTPNYPYTTATMAPFPPPPTTPGTMGPPSKPAERPQKEYEYDVQDSLAGTGIDLRAEDQYLADLYANSFTAGAKTGFPANAPGNRASFYGAGPANQPGEAPVSESQAEAEAKAAESAWDIAAARLAAIRVQELSNPFVNVPNVHRKAEKMCKDFGIGLNLDLKSTMQTIGRMKQPYEFEKPAVMVKTAVGPDGAMISTTGSFIPHDAYLVDQLALLSLATKHRLRELIEESDRLATVRQKSSHGVPPADWADASAPLPLLDPLASQVEDLRTGEESAVSPLTNPLKRSFDSAGPSQSFEGNLTQNPQPNELAAFMRDLAKKEREEEEIRLRKRQRRLQGATGAGPTPGTPAATSRSNSIAPGTPGSVAPESDAVKTPGQKKPPTKRDSGKFAELQSTASANQTLNTFMGGLGRKKGGKSYSWLTGGGSGASTPTRPGLGGSDTRSGTPAGATAAGGARKPERVSLTQEGRTRLGTWREDGDKGRGIQMRDWVAALEDDGRDPRALQIAYTKLDGPTGR